MRASITLIAMSMLLGACASGTRTPNVATTPQQGQTAEQQAADANQCRAVAEQESGYSPVADTAKGAGIGAVVGGLGGAAAGAAIGAATGGDPGKSAAIGAGAGAVTGGAAGGYYKYSRDRNGYDAAFKNCMQGRGYAVSSN